MSVFGYGEIRVARAWELTAVGLAPSALRPLDQREQRDEGCRYAQDKSKE